MHFIYSFLSLLAFSALSFGWPWPPPSWGKVPGFQNIENLLLQRQEREIFDNAQSTTRNPTSSVVQVTKAASTTPGSATDPPEKQTRTDGDAASDTTASKATKTTLAPISPVDPAGGVSLITPAITSGAQYYPIGYYVTFAWNYTSLLRNPKAVDVLAALSQSNANGAANTATYTLTQNMSFEATPTYLWDTNEWATSATPLAPGTYTLIIYDADASGGVTAVPSAGYLGVYDQYTFGMYTPAAYTALSPEFQCATCNAASSMQRMTVGWLLFLTCITVVSFTWFASESGLLL